jgi:hypothetical protein
MTKRRAVVDREEKLARKIVELLDEATEELCQRDAFINSGEAIARAVDALDTRWKHRGEFRAGVIDCLTKARN